MVFSPLVCCASQNSEIRASGQQISRGKLIWSDEFTGQAGAPPDPSKWTPGIGGHGWGNQQLEYDTDNQNTYLDGSGHLIIEARRENPAKYECWYGACNYTSAHITTSKHFDFTYGLIEARIKIPHGQGLWPTLWLLGNNCKAIGWPGCGEMDVMENIGSEPNTIYGSAHGPGAFASSAMQHPYVLPHGTFADDFHDFALQWSPDYLSFFVDNNHYVTITKASFSNQKDWVYDHPFFIILNLAVGGTWPGDPSPTAFPQKMMVDYVRVYSLANPE